MASQECSWSGRVSGITIDARGSGLMRRVDDLRQSITRQFVTWVPGDSGALLAGLVIGDESLLSFDARQAFLRTGSLHVVAVSGSNLTLLAAILVLVFGWIPRRWINELLALAMVWVYVLIAGASPPTLRAGMIATAGAGARLLGRPTDYLTLSITIAAIQVAILPHTLSGLSFRLTTVAIIVVVLAAAGRKLNSFWSVARAGGADHSRGTGCAYTVASFGQPTKHRGSCAHQRFNCAVYHGRLCGWLDWNHRYSRTATRR